MSAALVELHGVLIAVMKQTAIPLSLSLCLCLSLCGALSGHAGALVPAEINEAHRRMRRSRPEKRPTPFAAPPRQAGARGARGLGARPTSLPSTSAQPRGNATAL